MKIYKPYEDEKPVSRPNNAGNTMEAEYRERYDENGKPYLEKVGEVNTYEKIQSYREECDVMSILSRYAAGDTRALATPGYYIDTTKLPKTYTEYLNMMNDQHDKFNALPLEIRERFGHSFEQWAATAGEKQWCEKMGIVQNAQPDTQQQQSQTVQKGENKE